MSAPAETLISIGDSGVLNAPAGEALEGLWIDRDLSWLDFNERVLAEARDERNPMLERAKFLAIFSSNLDEFFMKRVAVLRKQLNPQRLELLTRIREKLLAALFRQADCFRNAIIPGLAGHGIFIRRWEELNEAQQQECSRYFDEQVSPALTPIVIDASHPFPFLSSLSTSLAFALKDMARGETMYARVKVPTVVKQWVRIRAGVKHSETLLVPLYEIVRGNIHKLYEGMELSGATLFRLTRDAEPELEEDPDEEYSEAVKERIRLRRYEPVVRLEFGPDSNPEIRHILCDRFGLQPFDVYDLPEEVDYNSLFELLAVEAPALRDSPWAPVVPAALTDPHPDIFGAIRAGDLLLNHPYESFDASVEHFVAAAAADPQTVAIKMTAYRIGDDTPFVNSLMKAAEAGKQVACIIEIQARFDEERNLHWAAELQRVGAHVIFGVKGLKVHGKTILVVRKESSGLRAYAHIGTGNYHVRTARLYADVGLLTCDPKVTRDAVKLFHYLTGHSQTPTYETLLVAPVSMRSRFLELVQREIENKREGKPARIIAKLNQLEDPEMIRALCEASAAGVSIDLIIRGFCCLRPGVPGRTENIRVRSIIGRFLEHSRIYYFANGSEDPLKGEIYIGSADWMYRNLSKRVEVVTPVLADGPKEKLWEILSVYLNDARNSWTLASDGVYSRLSPAHDADENSRIGTYEALMKMTRRRSDA